MRGVVRCSLAGECALDPREEPCAAKRLGLQGAGRNEIEGLNSTGIFKFKESGGRAN